MTTNQSITCIEPAYNTPDYLSRLRASFDADQPLLAPRIAYLNVIKRCNAGCKYCTDWKSDPDTTKDLPTSKVLEILEDLKLLGIQEVVLSGGEPFLRKDIFDIFESSIAFGLKVRTVTNGTAVTYQNAARLAKIGGLRIIVSIDSLDPVRMIRLRGLRLERVLGAIENLVAARSAVRADMYISLCVTITKHNIDDLVPLAEFAHSIGVGIAFQPVHFAGTGISDQILTDLWPNTAEVAKIERTVSALIELKRSGYAIGSRSDFLSQIPVFFRDKTFYPGEHCFAAYHDIVIDQDLGVRPCWSMEPLEYLNSKRIKDIWSSQRMKEQRALIRKKKCPGCMYSCHLNKGYVDLLGQESI